MPKFDRRDRDVDVQYDARRDGLEAMALGFLRFTSVLNFLVKRFWRFYLVSLAR